MVKPTPVIQSNPIHCEFKIWNEWFELIFSFIFCTHPWKKDMSIEFCRCQLRDVQRFPWKIYLARPLTLCVTMCHFIHSPFSSSKRFRIINSNDLTCYVMNLGRHDCHIICTYIVYFPFICLSHMCLICAFSRVTFCKRKFVIIKTKQCVLIWTFLLGISNQFRYIDLF